jgi:hypothetical protein
MRRLRILGERSRQDEEEFVAAVACGDIHLALLFHHDPSQMFERAIAGSVALPVIDLFEPVEVEHHE